MWKKDDLTDKLFQSAKLRTRTRLRLNGFMVEIGAPIWTKNGSTQIIAVNNLSWRLHQLRRISVAARFGG